MTSTFPPGSTEIVTAASTLVVAPHFDDEVLGCGGLLAQLSSRGAAVRVLFLSDSSGGVEAVVDRSAYAARRRDEAQAALAVLGVAGAENLQLPDGRLAGHQEEIARAIRRSLLTLRPRLLLVPSPFEVTPDHRAAFDAVHGVLASVRRDDELASIVAHLEVLLYEVNQPAYPNLLVDVSGEVATIERAMACYVSQEERHPYLQAALGLRRYRGLSLAPGPAAVEAYRRLDASAFQLTGPSALLRELGAQPEGGAAGPPGPIGSIGSAARGPRISVIVRTKDRPRLVAEALASIAASTYRRLEVVLVNDGGAEVVLAPDFPLPIVRVALVPGRGRAAAANAGLEAASGEFVSFLDDDDLVEPDHFEVLAGLVTDTGVRIAYTDAVVGVWELAERGWARVERRLPYSRDFDPDLLALDNYIPLNTLTIDRTLAHAAGPLDDALPFFEDWDWLLRLAALAPFHHHRRVTCEYRHFRGADHHALGGAPRERPDFLAMKARVLSKHELEPERLARAVDRLRGEAVDALEEATRASVTAREDRRAREAAESRYHQAHGEAQAARGHVELLVAETARLREGAEALRRQGDALRQESAAHQQDAGAVRAELERRDRELERLYGDEKALRATVEDQTAHLARLYAEVRRLEGVVRDMESSRAWRAHLWWQRRLGGPGGRDPGA